MPSIRNFSSSLTKKAFSPQDVFYSIFPSLYLSSCLGITFLFFILLFHCFDISRETEKDDINNKIVIISCIMFIERTLEGRVSNVFYDFVSFLHWFDDEKHCASLSWISFSCSSIFSFFSRIFLLKTDLNDKLKGKKETVNPRKECPAEETGVKDITQQETGWNGRRRNAAYKVSHFFSRQEERQYFCVILRKQVFFSVPSSSWEDKEVEEEEEAKMGVTKWIDLLSWGR